MNHDMFTEDPYEELKALIKFAHAADSHIETISNNQKLLMNEINLIKTKIDRIEEQMVFLEKMSYDVLEIVNAKNNSSTG